MIGPDVHKRLPYVEGGFGTIVSDNPWTFDDAGSRATPTYPVLSVKDMCAMPIASIAAAQSYLFLWVPSALLVEGLQVVAAWGFRYTTTMIWVKEGETGKTHIGMGHHVRNAHEIVLIANRGGITSADRSIPSFIKAPRTKHSTKPEAFSEAFERIGPAPRLELFARRVRPNWLCWGNEIDERAAWAGYKPHLAGRSTP